MREATKWSARETFPRASSRQNSKLDTTFKTQDIFLITWHDYSTIFLYYKSFYLSFYSLLDTLKKYIYLTYSIKELVIYVDVYVKIRRN